MLLTFDMSIPYAAASMYSRVADLFLWAQALYMDKLAWANFALYSSFRTDWFVFFPEIVFSVFRQFTNSHEITPKEATSRLPAKPSVEPFNFEIGL